VRCGTATVTKAEGANRAIITVSVVVERPERADLSYMRCTDGKAPGHCRIGALSGVRYARRAIDRNLFGIEVQAIRGSLEHPDAATGAAVAAMFAVWQAWGHRWTHVEVQQTMGWSLEQDSVRQSEETVIVTVGWFHERRDWTSVRGAVARLSFSAAVGAVLYSAGVTAFAWYAASQRTLELIQPWRRHWDLMFWLSESSEKLAWAAAAALLSVLVKPSRPNVAFLLLCVLLWLAHFTFHIGLIT